MIEGIAELPGIRLAYSDTGGDGAVVVLLHPNTGSLAVWAYQRPALMAAGFRVIAYSRRGHLGSDPGPEEAPGTGSGDLLALLDHLGLDRVHLMGTAAGAIVALDFALCYASRTLSATLACTILGITDPALDGLLGWSTGLGVNRMIKVARAYDGTMPASFWKLRPS